MDPVVRSIVNARQLPAAFERYIEDVYAPLAQRIAREARGAAAAPFVVGVCGPQGSGKSTIASVLQALLETEGVRTVTLSLDDLYLARAERLSLAQRIHPLLATRGVPGTHDVTLGLQVLDALAHDAEVALPSFDKARDDRRHQGQWPRYRGPAQVVLFEGWCVGARPQDEALLAAPINALECERDPDGRWRIYANQALATHYQRLFDRIGLTVLLRPPAFDVVYAWRGEQEQRLREQLEATHGDTSMLMSEADLRQFIAHYERLTKHILNEMPARADIIVDLDAARVPRLTGS